MAEMSTTATSAAASCHPSSGPSSYTCWAVGSAAFAAAMAAMMRRCAAP